LASGSENITSSPVLEEPVAVDPALLRVLDVVVDDELVHGREQLEVPDVREQVRLHDRELQRSKRTAPACDEVAMRSTVSSGRSGKIGRHRTVR
jgi:hypothetical protein